MLRFFRLFVIVSVSLALPTGRASTGPEVETNNGRMMGFAEIVEGVTVHTFLGIPFAEPPIGDLRFKPPVPISDWNNTLETKQLPKSCPQVPSSSFPGNPGELMWNPKTELSEDCLYLNIWVPDNSGRNRNELTTMLWIFGGGFVAGTTALDVYDGKLLAASTGVIVVTINYRVGPFGFLYLANDAAPGNMGLMDQNLALKWVHENIRRFGGDSDKICLFGESAGAASVHYHLLSEESRRYFANAILQSGSAMAPWAYRSPIDSYSISRKFAELVGCEQEDMSDLVTCLGGVDNHTLSSEQWNLDLSKMFSVYPFVPTIDGNFIKSSPSDSLRRGNYARKPLLLGVTKNEYSYFLMYGLEGQMDFQTGHLTNYDEDSLNDRMPLAVDPQMPRIIRSSILNQYDTHFPKNQGPSFIHTMDNLGGDFNFKCPTLAIANDTVYTINSTDPPSVYVYTYNHRASSNPWPLWSGVLHGDEVEFIFGMPLKEGSTFTEEEKHFSRRIMTFWSNFAKTGNPNIGVDLSTMNRDVEQMTQEETVVEQIMTLNKRSTSDDLVELDQTGPNVITNINTHDSAPMATEETDESDLESNILGEVIKEVNEIAQDQADNEEESSNQRHTEDQSQINAQAVDQSQLSNEIEALSPEKNHKSLDATQTTENHDTTSQEVIQTTADTRTVSEEITTRAGERQQDTVWPLYRQGEEKYIILQSGASFATETGLRHNECRFWNVFYKELQELLKESKKCKRHMH